ncbi:hypothetical protein ACJ2CR_08580 [Myxococcus faecalis]|uniref:hypothetical protein n=1 Tax=Myxococcus faecalis TaxID=3115646 RepID=UPI0038D04E7B
MGMQVRPLPEVEPSTPAPKGSAPEVEQTPSAPVSAGSRLLAVLGSWRARLALMSVWGVLLFVAFQPGLLSSDSLDMLAQGRAGRYSDWHSPFFSFVLGKSFALTGSTWPVLALQLLVLSLGPVLLLGRVSGRRGLGALALLVVYCLLPSTWAVGVTLWKDVFNAVMLLGTVVLLTRGRPGWAFACLVFATLTRHNAIVASVLLVPMVVARVPALMKERARPFIAGGILLGILACAPGFVERAMGAQKSWIAGALLVFDVVGVYVREPSAMDGSPLVERWQWTPEQLSGLYDPRSITPLLWGEPARGSISTTQVLEARDALTREWLRVVRTHPGAYLRHRLSTYSASLGLGDSSDSYYRDIGSFHRVIDPNDLGLTLRTHTAVHRALSAMREAFPWVAASGAPWLALTLALAVVGWRRRALDGGLMFCVAASGACYALAYLPVSVSAEYRFYYWTAISAFVASALWLARSSSDSVKAPALGSRS